HYQNRDRGTPVIIIRLRHALAPLLLLLSLSAHAETSDNLPVSIVPNRVDFEWDAHAMFPGSAARLIVTDSAGTYIWDVASKRLVRRIIYDTFARSHALTPDEETLISGHADGKIRLWSLATGAQLGVMQEKRAGDEADEITALTVSPDGAFVVSG